MKFSDYGSKEDAESAERELWDEFIATRSPEVRTRLAIFHLPLAYHETFRFMRIGLNRKEFTEEEALSAASLIMLRCIDSYNRDNKYKARFSTYYTWACRWSMIRYVRGTESQIKYFQVGDKFLSEMKCKSPEAADEFNFEFEVGESLESVLSQLGERDREIIERRFFRRETLDSIAKIYGISRERVRQLAKESIEKIRKMIGVEIEEGES